MTSPPIVSVEWLYENHAASDLIVLDATNKPADESINHLRLPGARFFDIKKTFSNTSAPFPNTIPSAVEFEREARKLGINKNSRIIVYDRHGIYSSPRVWWLFKTMGHPAVSVLDGGLPAWMESGHPTETITENTYPSGDFEATLDQTTVRYHQDVKENIRTKTECVIDARSTGRFNGTAPEPRAGLRGGHIPQSKSLPYTEVLTHGKFKSQETLRAYFDALTTEDKPLVFSCGSGITACILLLAAEIAEVSLSKSIYDGSWTEWATLEKE